MSTPTISQNPFENFPQLERRVFEGLQAHVHAIEKLVPGFREALVALMQTRYISGSAPERCPFPVYTYGGESGDPDVAVLLGLPDPEWTEAKTKLRGEGGPLSGEDYQYMAALQPDARSLAISYGRGKLAELTVRSRASEEELGFELTEACPTTNGLSSHGETAVTDRSGIYEGDPDRIRLDGALGNIGYVRVVEFAQAIVDLRKKLEATEGTA